MARDQVSVLARPIQACFTPQKDISAYELALILPRLSPGTISIIFMPTQWDTLEPELKRHFTQV